MSDKFFWHKGFHVVEIHVSLDAEVAKHLVENVSDGAVSSHYGVVHPCTKGFDVHVRFSVEVEVGVKSGVHTCEGKGQLFGHFKVTVCKRNVGFYQGHLVLAVGAFHMRVENQLAVDFYAFKQVFLQPFRQKTNDIVDNHRVGVEVHVERDVVFHCGFADKLDFDVVEFYL